MLDIILQLERPYFEHIEHANDTDVVWRVMRGTAAYKGLKLTKGNFPSSVGVYYINGHPYHPEHFLLPLQERLDKLYGTPQPGAE